MCICTFKPTFRYETDSWFQPPAFFCVKQTNPCWLISDLIQDLLGLSLFSIIIIMVYGILTLCIMVYGYNGIWDYHYGY